MRQCWTFTGHRKAPIMVNRGLPAPLESGGEALVRSARRCFTDRARDADAVEQFLLGADLAQPFVLAGRQRLAGDETGAGVGKAQLRQLVGFVGSHLVTGDAGYRYDALLDDIVAVLQRQRILLAQRQRLAQGGSELALLLRRIDSRFDRGLVPD